jgi:hypothetical protein
MLEMLENFLLENVGKFCACIQTNVDRAGDGGTIVVSRHY